MFEKQKTDLLIKKIELLREKQFKVLEMGDSKESDNIQKQIDVANDKLEMITGKRLNNGINKLNKVLDKNNKKLNKANDKLNESMAFGNQVTEDDAESILADLMKNSHSK